MKAHLLEDWDALAALAPEWNVLLRRSRADCLFLTWEWVSAWRAVVGDAVRPFVVAVREEDGTLAGLAPFYVTRMTLGGIIPYRTLRILGDYHSGAEYVDWIAREDREADAAGEIARALAGARNRWDCMWLPYVSGWTGARQRIAGACTALGFYCHEREAVFAAMALPEDYPTYERSLSKNGRAMLQKRKRQILALPGVSVERCRSEADRAAYLDALFDLNHRRWSAAGQPGTFVRKPLEAQFYREFTRVALERGWLRLFALKIEGKFKAVQAGYVYHRTFYQLQEGFDPEAPQGIGNVLRAHVIEQCIAEGVQTYDFLGEFSDHKRRWLAEPRAGHYLFIGRRGSLKNALLFAGKVWPTGRYLRPSPLRAPAPPVPGAEGARGTPLNGGAAAPASQGPGGTPEEDERAVGAGGGHRLEGTCNR